MSKGYGVMQKLIIEKLADLPKDKWLPLIKVLPDGHTKSEYQALHRAAKTLEQKGMIKISYADWGEDPRYIWNTRTVLSLHHPDTEIISIRDKGPVKVNPVYWHGEEFVEMNRVYSKCIPRATVVEVDT